MTAVSEGPRGGGAGSGRSSSTPPSSRPAGSRPSGRRYGQADSGRRPLTLITVLVVGLGLGGGLFGVALSGLGQPINPPQSLTKVTVPVPGASASPVPASDAQAMGLVPLGGKPAPGFTLTDQSNQPTSLASLDRGRGVVLTFVSHDCNVTCPVIVRELAGAQKALAAAGVRIVLVDANAAGSSPAAARSFLAGPGAALGASGDVTFLTGSGPALRSVWSSYGIQTGLGPGGTPYHSEGMWFLAPGGAMIDQATPYANEQPNGVGTLPAAAVAQWSQGIVRYAAAAAKG